MTSNLEILTQPSNVRDIFDRIANDYDRFNAWASLGMHQSWRKALIRRIPGNARVLDVATGTGDVAFLAAHSGFKVVGLDFSQRMLSIAMEKDKNKAIRWVPGSVEKLPFSDLSFGCVTSAFALRNFRPCLTKALGESFRVLKRGGKVVHMDFGRPSSRFSRMGHRLHLQYSVPLIGQMICGNRWPSHYLETTIDHFYTPEEMRRHLTNAGFSDVTSTPLCFGAVQIYEGTKC